MNRPPGLVKMSKFFSANSPKAVGSAVSLGGEWTSQDQAEANKYKSALYNHFKQKRKPKKPRSACDRPKSTPEFDLPHEAGYIACHTPPPKSAPPGSRPRCDRFFDVDQLAGRKALSPHLKIKRSPRKHSLGNTGMVQEYSLGSGVTMAKTRSKLAVTMDSGLPLNPPPKVENRQRSPVNMNIPDGRQVEKAIRPAVSWSPNSHVSSADINKESPVSRTGSCQPLSALFSSDSGTLHESTSPHSDSPSEALIAQLQQQVADLGMFLEEERLNHRTTKEKAAAALKEQLQDLDRKHLERFSRLQEDYEDKLDIIKQVHRKEKEHQKASLDMQIARMKGELEFLQGAFDAYKKTLVEDMEEKWSKKEQNMRHKLHEEMENVLHQQRIELLEEKNQEKNSTNRDFQEQMEMMAKDHKKEIEALMRKFSSASPDAENLRRALDQLKAVRDELDQTADRLALTEETLQDTREELKEAKLKLLSHQDTFKNRMDEVDDKYKARIDRLMQDNVELRKQYIAKCDELFNEKSSTEYRRVAKVASTKELLQMIVHAKNRANVNMASGDRKRDKDKVTDLALQTSNRPTSAPTTRRECRSAFRNAGDAGNRRQTAVTRDDQKNCPQTTSSGHRKLNRVSLQEKSFSNLKAASMPL